MKLTFEAYKTAFGSLSERQQKWVRAKAQWEHMSLWAVMNDWEVPKHNQLNTDGTWKGETNKRTRTHKVSGVYRLSPGTPPPSYSPSPEPEPIHW